MKRVTRAQLRGQPLDADCKKTDTVTGEFGKEDKRVFCFGLRPAERDWDILPKCKTCKAYIENAEPLSSTLLS